MKSKLFSFALGISLLLFLNCKILNQLGILCPNDEFVVTQFDKTHVPFSENCEEHEKQETNCFCEQDFSNPSKFKFIKSFILVNSVVLISFFLTEPNSNSKFTDKTHYLSPKNSFLFLNSIHLQI